jgi:regulator of protease activity HflC (stomatin/prohibitin superfamily)
MADPRDEESTRPAGPPTTDGGNGAPTPGVSVNWRGIVDDDAPQPKTVRFFRALGRGIVAVLVGLGLKRKRRPDGTLAPRPWGRVAVIWGTFIVVVGLLSAGHIVGAGNVGVPVTLGSAEAPLDAGLHFTAPWPITRVAQISTRTQNYTMSATKGDGNKSGIDDSVTVLGRDGATAQVDATVLFRVDRENATKVYETVGTNFTTPIIRPSARACIRSEFTTRDLVAASTADWPEISQNIQDCMAKKIEPRGITLEDFQLRDVRLSPQVQQAIEAQVAATQTQNSQLSDAYLQFAYIQALRAFADSKNNSTIIVPNTNSGTGSTVQPVLPVPTTNSP